MKKKDFTPQFVRDAIYDYLVNQDFPNELYDVGSKIYITGLADLEISSVRTSGPNFVVDGTGTVELETDMGEGDTASDGYPLRFSYEFGTNGEIVAQRSRYIDTSSFFAGNDDYETFLVEPSGHLASFQNSLMGILSLLAQPPAATADRKCLYRLLHVQVVTILECYLSDFFISRIKDNSTLLRKFIETTPTFKEQKTTVADVFKTMDSIEKRANAHLARLVWHRLNEVSKLYQKVLGLAFPSDMKAIRDVIDVRHELVHRNGRKPDGTVHEIGEADVKDAIELAEKLVGHIENGYQAT
jgi:hypothetical protein